ncbi:hypothetical protein SEUBUCD646_0I00860 [Saccharomyces eubayanus]|uniref:Uncharacterized protein n=2 Tax=Saccharomyces TaxID=4930 RepID=A0A6C1E9S3_SACPS|nr:hypothetical protein GRS66_008386 [Saccharomyces pastorianus]CAI2037639.1 hypothetical protein SEUBUCD650_0I00860 [Saccharomyces eubayanus]CAI2049042.1 hypothetical protein SEUBUCD646_0I00860 [Saccharomyces eubayanus]
MVNKSKFDGGNGTATNGNAPSSRNHKKKYSNCRKKSVASSVRCGNFGIARMGDDEKQVSRIFDKMNHLKKFSAEEDDDRNLFIQWSDDITDTLSGLWWTGTFLKLLISSALTGRAKKWFDSTTEGIDDHSIRTYTLEKFLALLSGEFDGIRVLRRERFAELLELSINSETSLEKFAKISELLTPYYLSSSAALDLFLTKLEPCLQKQLGDTAFPMTLDIALLVAACEFAKGTSKERNDEHAENDNNNNNNSNNNGNTIDLDPSVRKNKNTIKTNKKCKNKHIHENIDNAIKKSNGKKNRNEEGLQVIHPKRRKQNESGKQLSLSTAVLADIVPLDNSISNTNASNKHFNVSNPVDSYTSKRNGSQNHPINEMPTLDGNRSFPITIPAAANLAYDKVESVKNETNIHYEAINDIPLSLASGSDFVKRNVAESMSWKSIRGNAGVPDSNAKSDLRGDESNRQMARRSHAAHISSHSNTPEPRQTAWHDPIGTNFAETNKIVEITNLNPFTKHENTIGSDKPKGSNNPITSMKVNKPGYFIDLEKPQSMHNGNRNVGLLAQKSYPLHNFAVRTRNAHFNDRPSNYTSAHGNLNAIHPLSLRINNIQCLSRPGIREADTNKEVHSPKMTVQEKGTVNSAVAKDKDGRSNSVENPFLGNTLNGTKLNSYYI